MSITSRFPKDFSEPKTRDKRNLRRTKWDVTFECNLCIFTYYI